MLLRGAGRAGCVARSTTTRVATAALVPARCFAPPAPLAPLLAPSHRFGLGQSPVSTKAVAVKFGKAPPRDEIFTKDPANNVSDYIYEKMGINLHQQRDHPIGIIKQVS
jgi:phenylalanyl-tRNA synthetase alpha chain